MKTAALDAAVTAFTTASNVTTLSAAQAAFKTAYLAWETCREYQFGPAADQSLLTNTINVFPVDSTVIKSNRADIGTSRNKKHAHVRHTVLHKRVKLEVHLIIMIKALLFFPGIPVL